MLLLLVRGIEKYSLAVHFPLHPTLKTSEPRIRVPLVSVRRYGQTGDIGYSFKS